MTCSDWHDHEDTLVVLAHTVTPAPHRMTGAIVHALHEGRPVYVAASWADGVAIHQALADAGTGAVLVEVPANAVLAAGHLWAEA